MYDAKVVDEYAGQTGILVCWSVGKSHLYPGDDGDLGSARWGMRDLLYGEDLETDVSGMGQD